MRQTSDALVALADLQIASLPDLETGAERSENTPVERSEAQGAGAQQANAQTVGHCAEAAAVASPQGKQPSG